MRLILPAIALLALAGCANTVPDSVYALGASLATAENGVTIYEASPVATPSEVATLKSLDAKAYAVVSPLVANGNNATADELAAGQAAIAALTTELAKVKS